MRKRPRLWSLVPKVSCALALAGFVATLGLPQRALAQDDDYYVTYYDVATSASPSRAGYGGPGFSGGAGDNTVRITNPGSDANQTLCAMIYVFDDFEELQACCGCPVTPDGLRTLSTINNLTFNFGVNKGNLNAGVIKLISSTYNFVPGNPNPTGVNPPGTNGATSGNIPLACSPTGAASNDPFHRAAPVNPTPALRAWMTHDELQEPGNIPSGHAVQGVSVEEFQASPLDSTELANLQEGCELAITGGSGVGTCTCGSGDVVIQTGKTASTKRHHH
jgi:hypothetical protein